MICLEALVHNQLSHGEILPRSDSSSELLKKNWSDLRDRLDYSRQMIINLPDFIFDNFGTEVEKLTQARSRMIHLWEKYCKRLEIAEARIRDEINMKSSERATEMAQISIQESKRVMLRKFCLLTSGLLANCSLC